MKTRVLRRKGCVTLIADRGVSDAPHEVLACLQQMADSSNWFIVDIRLLERPVAHEFSGSPAAEDFCANIKPESEAERAFHISRLKEYVEQSDGSLMWCTYRNLWRGEQGIDDYIPPSIVKPSIYMPFKTGLKNLQGIRDYWEAYSGLISDAKIENLHRQPREGDLMRAWWMIKKGYAAESFEP